MGTFRHSYENMRMTESEVAISYLQCLLFEDVLDACFLEKVKVSLLDTL